MGSVTTPNTVLFVTAVNAIISLRGDYYSNGQVQVWDLRESGESISVDLDLANDADLPGFHSQLNMSVTITKEEIESTHINGEELPVHMLNEAPRFLEATTRVVATAVDILNEMLDDLEVQAIRREWVELDSESEQLNRELDELTAAVGSGIDGLNQGISRRQAIRHLSKFAVKAGNLGRL